MAVEAAAAVVAVADGEEERASGASPPVVAAGGADDDVDGGRAIGPDMAATADRRVGPVGSQDQAVVVTAEEEVDVAAAADAVPSHAADDRGLPVICVKTVAAGAAPDDVGPVIAVDHVLAD